MAVWFLENGFVEERKIALIPTFNVQSGLGPKDYGVLLTDQRIILVMEKSSKANVLGAAFGVAGALLAEAVASERQVDYMNASPEQLAGSENNLCIPYASIQRLRLKRNFTGAIELRLEFLLPDGKRKKMTGFLTVPDQLIQQRKAQGLKLKQIQEEYARRTQEALRKALPPGAQQHVEWFE